MPIKFRTGKMRLVQGDPTAINEVKDQKGNTTLNKDGTARTEIYIGLAAPKGSAEWLGVESQLKAEAKAGWGTKLDPEKFKDFSWKWFDGDDTDKYGKPLADKNPAVAGQMVLRMTRNGNFGLPQMFARAVLLPEGHPERVEGQPGPLVELDVTTAKKLFKRGYYVRAFGECDINNNEESAGIYVNLIGLELVEYGEEIVSQARMSGEEMFGDDDEAPAPKAAPAASPSKVPPKPYAGHLPPPPGGPKLTAAAEATAPGMTLAEWNAAGWSNEDLKANGFLA